MLLIVAFIVSIALMMMYDAAYGIEIKPWIVPIYIAGMILFAWSVTFVFGRPTMVTWYGFATPKRLEKARLKYQESRS